MALVLAGLLAMGAASVRAGSLSDADLDLYRAAFRHAESERWDEATRVAAEPRERLPGKVMRWLDLARPQSGNTFSSIADFIRANPRWPNQTGLLRQAELTMPAETPAAEARVWFNQHPPVSAAGMTRYAEALIATGEAGKAAEIVRKFWLDNNFVNNDDELEFRRHFAGTLRPHDHLARLDRVLWDHQDGAARRMLSLVDEGHQAVALARLALAGDEVGLDGVLRRVPDSLAGDPGLAYERLHWRRKKDNDAGALELLRSPPPELGRPALWWTERNILIRRVLEKRDYALAYRLAKAHGQTEGQPLAEAEFLAGWIALRYLKQPSDAFDHFHRMSRAAATPMSKARGAYWCGRAAEALGDRKQSREWYTAATKFPTMYYGQLAGVALGDEKPLALPPEPTIPAAEAADFNRRELVRVVRLLHEIDPRDNADRVGLFLRRLGKDASAPAEFALLAKLAEEVRRPDMAIFVAKQAFAAGVTLAGPGYPTLALHQTGGVEPGLVLSLIRQESTFNTNIVSSAGAKGLMQLMPGTAQLVANKLGVRHTDARLIGDPDYNVMLGATYIGQMIDTWGGSYILAIAAYNAGPGRVHDWLSKYGDPRGAGGVEPVDWVESIPIAETRNYVQRILEALQVYRARLGQAGGDRTLKRDLRRG